MDQLDHPLKKEIEEARRIILGIHEQITEHIKWNAPSFCFNGDDRVTFNLQGKGFFRIVFHCGAKKRPEQAAPIFEDATGLLEWASNDRAIVKIFSLSDIEDKKEKLIEVVAGWMQATS